MTAILSIVCSDGVVVAADSAATFAAGQMPTIEQPTDKIEVIEGRVIVAGTGQIGLGQRFCAIVKKHWAGQKKNAPVDVGRFLAGEAVKDFASTNAPQGAYGALVAFGCGEGPQCIEFATPDFQPELKTSKIWYAAMGSGQMILDPFLAFMREVFWESGPPKVEEGVFAATWLIDHAIAVNPGGVGAPLRIAVVENKPGNQYPARLVTIEEIGQHREHVAAAKKHLRNWRTMQSPAAGKELPTPPKLDGAAAQAAQTATSPASLN